MVAYISGKIISITDLGRNISAALSSLTNHKNHKITTVMISIDAYEKLKEADKNMNKNS